MGELHNRIRKSLSNEYSRKIKTAKNKQDKIEFIKRRELLENDEELLKEMKDRKAIYDLGIKDLKCAMELKKQREENRAIRDIKAHAETTEKMIEEIIKKRGYER